MTENWRQKAYDKLLRDGWHARSAGLPDGPCCAGGAIAWAITGDPEDLYRSKDNEPQWESQVQPALQEFGRFLGIDEDRIRPVDIYDWNDDLYRTEEEVLETFKRFAEAD